MHMPFCILELELPTSLTATERAYVHRYCDTVGLKHKSKGYHKTIVILIKQNECFQKSA